MVTRRAVLLAGAAGLLPSNALIAQAARIVLAAL
jgi:hypothetical protein